MIAAVESLGGLLLAAFVIARCEPSRGLATAAIALAPLIGEAVVMAWLGLRGVPLLAAARLPSAPSRRKALSASRRTTP